MSPRQVTERSTPSELMPGFLRHRRFSGPWLRRMSASCCSRGLSGVEVVLPRTERGADGWNRSLGVLAIEIELIEPTTG